MLLEGIYMIENIDWQVTSCCNRMCDYCFGPSEENEMAKADAIKCVDLFHDIGVKQIGLSGGEPLMCPYFEELIQYIHSKNINLYLSTNCDLYCKYSYIIKNNVNIIGIPIDGGSREIHDIHRGTGNFEACIKAMEDIMKSDSSIRMKIGTVLTKDNIDNLECIAELIAPYEKKIVYWKLYELIGYEKNYTSILDLKPTSKISISRLNKYFNGEKIINDQIKMRNRSYFFVKPNGDVFIPILNDQISKELIVGNLLQNEIDEIISRFVEEVSWKGYRQKYRYMRQY